MSASGSGASWLSLLEEKKQEVEEALKPGKIPRNICTLWHFRSAFEDLCAKKGEYKPTRLETNLIPRIQITDLARAVSQSSPDLRKLPPGNTLEALLWGLIIFFIEHGCKAGAPLSRMVILATELNKKVPTFSIKPREYKLQFPDEKRVQKPLQDVYSLFIQFHLDILSHMKKNDPKSNADPLEDPWIQKQVNNVGTALEEARGKYDFLVNQVAEDKEREKKEQEQPSLDGERHLRDYLHANSNADREVQVRFVSKRFLGRGSFGEVDEVRELSTGFSYARKHIHLDTEKTNDSIADEVRNEVTIMQKLRHLHIATVLFQIKDKDAYSIFMLPVADHDLGKFLNICTKEEYPAALTCRIFPWFGCILDALAYAHKLGIKHNDIKPSNILIKNFQPYLCDFGLAKEFSDVNGSCSNSSKVVGSRAYHAPEVRARQDRGRRADVFALGCVYSEMLSICRGKSLEEYRDARETDGSIIFRECLTKVEKWISGFETKDDKLNDLLVWQILRMVREKPEERDSSEQALNTLKQQRALFCIE